MKEYILTAINIYDKRSRTAQQLLVEGAFTTEGISALLRNAQDTALDQFARAGHVTTANDLAWWVSSVQMAFDWHG